MHSSLGSLQARYCWFFPFISVSCTYAISYIIICILLCLGVTGRVLLELGYIETHLLRSSREQSPTDITALPDSEGSTLYKLLTDPDSVNLEHLNSEVFNVSIGID